MNYKGLQFSNTAEKTVEIDIEGYIGYDPYDSPKNQANTKEKMKAELKKLASLKAETIIVNINSYGGDVNHGISIHDLLAENKAKIITKVNGMTASSATIIAMAGDERKMSDNALFLIHNASSFGYGDKNDIKILSEDLKTIDDRIANIYSKVTGKSKDDILNLMNEDKGRGKWLTSEEAKKLGFITEVFEPLKAVAYFSNDILSRFQLPLIPDNKISDEVKPNSTAKQVITELKKFFKHNNSITMNKPKLDLLTKAVNCESLEVQDGGIFLSTEQAQAVETLLESNSNTIKAYSGLEDGESIKDLKDQITSLTSEKESLETENSSLKEENEKLSKKTVIKTGAVADGDNEDPGITDKEAEHFYNLSQIH